MDAGSDPVAVRPAERREIHAALRLILGSAGRPADESAVVDFLDFALQRHIDLNALWVAVRSERPVWAMLPMVSPGRTMLLLTPGGLPRIEGIETAGTLTDEVCQHYRARGVQLVQALGDPADDGPRDGFLARGFRQMAELLYLQVDVRPTFPAPPLPNGFTWQSYVDQVPAAFADTIVQTYRDSLDCPGLNGLRSIDDVMAGHKAAGGAEFDPSLWFLLREHGDPIGVVLLARTPGHNASELVYLGLVPAARGRGLADLLMRQALHAIASRGGGTLALAVDSQNAPAIRLYHRHGLKKVGAKLALLRELRETNAPHESGIAANTV
jgi:ribosomal protein S18 acetylase RimI-like enzyme